MENYQNDLDIENFQRVCCVNDITSDDQAEFQSLLLEGDFLHALEFVRSNYYTIDLGTQMHGIIGTLHCIINMNISLSDYIKAIFYNDGFLGCHVNLMDALSATDSEGWLPLHRYVEVEDEELVNGIIAIGANPFEWTSPRGTSDKKLSALHVAVKTENPKMIKLVVDYMKGADNVMEDFVQPAVYYAIERVCWRGCMMLLSECNTVFGLNEVKKLVNRLVAVFEIRDLPLTNEFLRIAMKEIESDHKIAEWHVNLVDESPCVICYNMNSLDHVMLPSDDIVLSNSLKRRFRENPARIGVINGPECGVLRKPYYKRTKLIEVKRKAKIEDLIRVHDPYYIKTLRERCETADLHRINSVPLAIDSDTPVTQHSWETAVSSVGCVLEAVDLVCGGQAVSAFCPIRPPGHHLGTWGAAQVNLLPEESEYRQTEDIPIGSQGFCLLNNVALGAAYAKYRWGERGMTRIAIVDFDVHHGNGTEQIVRNIGWKWKKIIGKKSNTSTHPMDVKWEIDALVWLGWSDTGCEKDLFFGSSQVYNSDFYPRSGETSLDQGPPIICNLGYSPNTQSDEFRELWEKQILSQVQKFQPHLIFISAGFDAHMDDIIGGSAAGGSNLSSEDYYWLTQKLVNLLYVDGNKNRCGGIVSVLEGGYTVKGLGLSPLARSVQSHVEGLEIKHFADNI